MGGHYEKDMYKQFCEMAERLDSLEKGTKQDRKEIKRLNKEVDRVNKRNTVLEKKLVSQGQELAEVRAENKALKKENKILREDNERMKRILNNNSDNSSLPPSSDKSNNSVKAANEYNGREKSSRRQGAQAGHKGTTLSKSDVKSMIDSGKIRCTGLKEIGTPSDRFVTRYVLDFSMLTTAQEVRIYANENGKYNIPEEYRADVSYGNGIRAVISMLYSDGIMANDRIANFINGLSGDTLKLSNGTVYNVCRKFSELCATQTPVITNEILANDVLCTDATTMYIDGNQKNIRNFSSERSVLYTFQDSKALKVLAKLPILSTFSGTLIHDHETAMYHFGTGHGECNVHLIRYLRKNTEESGNTWSKDMMNFLRGMNSARKKRISEGENAFSLSALEKYYARYDELIARGREENETTSNRIAKKEEKTLLNRLEKYKENHLLFLRDFRVYFDDNMSERDLRMCKIRQKMSGGFRKESGIRMFCSIMSLIGTIKRRSLNVFTSIRDLFEGRPVIA